MSRLSQTALVSAGRTPWPASCGEITEPIKIGSEAQGAIRPSTNNALIAPMPLRLMRERPTRASLHQTSVITSAHACSSVLAAIRRGCLGWESARMVKSRQVDVVKGIKAAPWAQSQPKPGAPRSSRWHQCRVAVFSSRSWESGYPLFKQPQLGNTGPAPRCSS